MAQAERQTAELRWQQQGETLFFHGSLSRETLSLFWPRRGSHLQGVCVLDVSGLTYVDSYGLALLVNLLLSFANKKDGGRELKLTGSSSHLQALIQLYNLAELLPEK